MKSPSKQQQEDSSGGSHHAMISIGQGGAGSIHRVLPQLLSGKPDIYKPSIASFGPYHYNNRSDDTFRPSEALKDETVGLLCGDKEDHLRERILESIEHVRSHYAGTIAVTDQELSEMMLRDSCLAIAIMKLTAVPPAGRKINQQEDEEEEDDDDSDLLLGMMLYNLGVAGAQILFKDFGMLENQIPLFVLRLVLELLLGPDKGRAMLCRYLFMVNFDHNSHGDGDHVKNNIREMIDGQRQQLPLHLLEANRMILIHLSSSAATTQKQQPFYHHQKNKTPPPAASSGSDYKLISRPFRSVTDLKARGIRVGPSSSCVTDIRFSSSAFAGGHLQLPTRYVSRFTMVYFSNLVALEMSPEAITSLEVTSYVNFMKSLLVGPQDVKELRDRGVLYSDFGNDEEVLRVFREIDTYGLDGGVHVDVKTRIERHCSSKAKTWMAELVNTKFRSPWTTIAFVAAVVLLCLAFLQTLFTIHPAGSSGGNNNNNKNVKS